MTQFARSPQRMQWSPVDKGHILQEQTQSQDTWSNKRKATLIVVCAVVDFTLGTLDAAGEGLKGKRSCDQWTHQ
jgi:hypothetical protein